MSRHFERPQGVEKSPAKLNEISPFRFATVEMTHKNKRYGKKDIKTDQQTKEKR